MPELQIPEKLLPLITKPKRFKVIIGGRGSGKSVGVSDILIMMVDQKGYSVACGREFQNSIDDSVHNQIRSEIQRLEAPGFEVQSTRINHRNGGGFSYKGLSRNPESIKSMQGVNIFWVEEAQSLSQRSIEVLTPTIREEGSEIWFTGNPGSAKDPFSQRFIKPYEKELRGKGYYEDDLHLILFVNYCDNPWFPVELEKERQHDYENKPRAKYNHIWLGDYDDTVDNAIILPDWFDACIDAHEKLGFEPRGIEVVSHDPSDTGPDAKGLAYRHGVVFLDVDEREFGDINQGCDWATDYAVKVKPDLFVWDGDGMGVGLRRQIGQAFQGKRIQVEMFRGSASVDRPDAIYEDGKDKGKSNKQTFKNRRAQMYWELRDRIYRTYQAVNGKYIDPDELISFSSKIEKIDLLRSEICRIPTKPNPTGLIQIMTKEEMRKLGIESPNMADAVMMSLVTRVEQADIDLPLPDTGSWMAA